MKRTLNLLLSLTLALLASSCLEEVNLDTGEDIINVFCVLGHGPEQTLELSYIATAGRSARPVDDGTVVTLLEDGVEVGRFEKTSGTSWTLDFTPKGGRLYRLEVDVPKKPLIYAETTYPPVSSLQRVGVYPTGYEGQPAILWLNYYHGSAGFKLAADVDQVLWCYFENRGDGRAISQYTVTDHPGVDPRGETIYPYDYSSPIVQNDFEMEEFNTSLTGIYSEAFYGVPAFLHSGPLRIKHPAGFSREIPEDMITVHGIDSSDWAAKKSSGMFGIAGVNRSYMQSDMVICSVSDEYDRYLSDFYFSKASEDDFTSLVYKPNYYSNVHEGVGLFAASQEYRVEAPIGRWMI